VLFGKVWRGEERKLLKSRQDSPHSRTAGTGLAWLWIKFQMKGGGRNAWLGQLQEVLPPPSPPWVQGDVFIKLSCMAYFASGRAEIDLCTILSTKLCSFLCPGNGIETKIKPTSLRQPLVVGALDEDDYVMS
jgi:hypothetical protein